MWHFKTKSSVNWWLLLFVCLFAAAVVLWSLPAVSKTSSETGWSAYRLSRARRYRLELAVTKECFKKAKSCKTGFTGKGCWQCVRTPSLLPSSDGHWATATRALGREIILHSGGAKYQRVCAVTDSCYFLLTHGDAQRSYDGETQVMRWHINVRLSVHSVKVCCWQTEIATPKGYLCSQPLVTVQHTRGSHSMNTKLASHSHAQLRVHKTQHASGRGLPPFNA